MKDTLEIKVCESLQHEVSAVLAEEGWPNFAQKSVSACFGCRAYGPEPSSRPTSEGSGRCDAFCLLERAPSAELSGTLAGSRTCSELLGGKALCNLLVGQGALVVTPGQLARWRNQTAETYFHWRDTTVHGKRIAKVAMLDSGVDPAARENVQAFAETLGLPWDVVPVGLDYFRLVLKDRIRSLRGEDGTADSKPSGTEQGCAVFRTSELKYRSLFEASPISVWEVDLSRAKAYVDSLRMGEGAELEAYFDGHPEAVKKCAGLSRILDVNRATLELFQATGKKEFLGNPERFLGEGFLRPFRDGLIALASGERTFEEEGIHRPPSGEVRTLQVRLSAVPGYESSLEMAIVSVIDITERRKVENALERVNRLQREFISTAAHELRTPLASVLGYAELLLNPEAINGIGPDQQREFLSIIFEKGEALNRIVDNLLDLSRIESGKTIPLVKAPCGIRQMIREVVDRYRKKARDHRFELVLPEEIDALEVDRGRIVQVLENLLSNAVKYSSANSLIRLVGEVEEKGFVLSVEDEGIGMDREQTRRVFEKFYRADTSDTAVQGFGLGMCIAKNVVDAHGGRIWVDSRRGRGTKVTFSLPAASG